MSTADVPIPEPITVDEFVSLALDSVGHCSGKRVKIFTEFNCVILKLPAEKCIHWPHKMPQGASIHPYITANGKSGLQIEMLYDFLIR